MVHGGSRYTESVVIDDDVMGVLENFVSLAPLQQPHTLTGIRAVLAFTGGIGEHDSALRRDVCAALAHLGVALDAAANAAAIGGPVRPLHAPHSTVEVWMVPTDAGSVAAADALELLGLARAASA